MTEDKHHQFTASPNQWEKLKPLAREMRHTPTAAEDAMWQLIRNRRISQTKFRRQHAVEGFVVDFVSIECKLIIEVDGSVHEQAEQQAYDTQRQSVLEAHGFKVLRFSNADVLQHADAVSQMIAAVIEDANQCGL